MAKRSDSIFGSVVVLLIGVSFILFWITTASRHGAPAVFPIFGIIGLLVLLFGVGGTILKTLGERSRNEAAPVLASAARVATKRAEIRSRGKSHSTTYYATFDLRSGARLELELDGAQYGLLAEGDRGELRYQGSWFLGFERTAGPESPPETVSGPSLLCEYCGAINSPNTSKCAGCGSGKLTPAEPKVQS
jgi:ribosomal protein L40E